jgi:hypothetical protein
MSTTDIIGILIKKGLDSNKWEASS